MHAEQEPLRIWYVSKYVSPPAHATVGSRGYRLMQELAARGHDVTIVTSTANHLAETPDLKSRYRLDRVDGMRLLWVRTLGFTGAKSLRRILSWLHFELGVIRAGRQLPERPDVIIGSSLSLFTVLSALYLRRRHRAKFVFEVRDIWPLTIEEEGGFSAKNPFVMGLAAVERLGYRRADAIVGTMPNLAEHVREVLGEDRPTYCVPMGYVDGEQADVALPEAYVRAGVPHGKTLIGYAGTIGITNALDSLFACAQMLADDDRVHFVIVGDGGLRSSFEAAYGHLGNITFVGRVPRTSVQRVLQEFDVLYFSTFPSRVWKYGQSLNKLIDYMLAGKPIIGSYAGYPSMIDEAKAGVFVDPADAEGLAREITALVDLSPAERQAIGARGAAWVREHRRYPSLAADYEDILRSL